MIKKYLRQDQWSPYIVGSFIGLLLTFVFLADHGLGVSTGIARISALLNNMVFPRHIELTPYFSKILKDKVLFNWNILFVLGIFLGSFIASKISKNVPSQKHTILEKRYLNNQWKRQSSAFIGGALILFGARLANGCTSGHAITGGAQLSIVSFAFMLALFLAAIPTAQLLYRKEK